MFTARYGLITYIKQITFRLLKVNHNWWKGNNFQENRKPDFGF